MSVGKERVYDKELIYARVIGLLASSRDINSDDVFVCELAAYPSSMFNPDGEIKILKSISTLKQKLQETVSERNCRIQNIILYDVSALLWVINWPLDKLHVYVDGFRKFVFQALQRANVTLVFDRYFPNSTRIREILTSKVDQGTERASCRVRLDTCRP